MTAARFALFFAFSADRMTGVDDPTLIPQTIKAAKYSGMSPCMASACRIPTAAEEL